MSRTTPLLRRILLAGLVGAALPGGPLTAQVPIEFAPGSAMLSRSDLTELLRQYEMAIASAAYTDRIKDELRAASERVRTRLEKGDFQPGDRVVIEVQGQPSLPDSVLVEPGPKITLPLFGEISLDGVLRSEISEHLTRELGRMIREPVVRAQGLMRLSIQGAVGRPGFYTVPTDILISDALMLAGGPGQGAKLDELRIERAARRLYGGQELQAAMIGGRTLDQLSLQAGDQIVLPVATPSVWGGVGRYALILATTLIFGFSAIR